MRGESRRGQSESRSGQVMSCDLMVHAFVCSAWLQVITHIQWLLCTTHWLLADRYVQSRVQVVSTDAVRTTLMRPSYGLSPSIRPSTKRRVSFQNRCWSPSSENTAPLLGSQNSPKRTSTWIITTHPQYVKVMQMHARTCLHARV